jgi:hypothetical protein
MSDDLRGLTACQWLVLALLALVSVAVAAAVVWLVVYGMGQVLVALGWAS